MMRVLSTHLRQLYTDVWSDTMWPFDAIKEPYHIALHLSGS